MIHINVTSFTFPDGDCQHWNSTRVFYCSLRKGVYFEILIRKFFQCGHLCAALRCAAAARSHVQCLTKPPRSDCASRTCAAVMAARESEEDNKWTAAKRLKGETEKMTSCHVTVTTFSTSRLLSCLRWLLVYLACRCVCVVKNLVELLDGTRTYTHAGQ